MYNILKYLFIFSLCHGTDIKDHIFINRASGESVEVSVALPNITNKQYEILRNLKPGEFIAPELYEEYKFWRYLKEEKSNIFYIVERIVALGENGQYSVVESQKDEDSSKESAPDNEENDEYFGFDVSDPRLSEMPWKNDKKQYAYYKNIFNPKCRVHPSSIELLPLHRLDVLFGISHHANNSWIKRLYIDGTDNRIIKALNCFPYLNKDLDKCIEDLLEKVELIMFENNEYERFEQWATDISKKLSSSSAIAHLQKAIRNHIEENGSIKTSAGNIFLSNGCRYDVNSYGIYRLGPHISCWLEKNRLHKENKFLKEENVLVKKEKAALENAAQNLAKENEILTQQLQDSYHNLSPSWSSRTHYDYDYRQHD